MTIVISDNYRGKEELEKKRILCIKKEQASKEDIRPLRIGIINLMPKAESYELNLLFPLGRSIIQIEPVWIRLDNHVYSSTDKDHLKNEYVSFKEAIKKPLDGLIISPAPIEDLPFEEVTYWNELSAIIRYARKNIPSTLGLCWGGLALSKILGIEKQMYEKKLFGVFRSKNMDKSNKITGEMDDIFYCPQSRHAGIDEKTLEIAENEGKIHLLAHAEDIGYFLFESSDGKFIMHLGHPEYHTSRLVEEYIRDMKKGRKDVEKPVNVDLDNPVNIWRSHGFEFFSQWIKYIHDSVAF